MKKISKKMSTSNMLATLICILNLTLFVTTAQGNIININGTLQEPDCLSIRYSDAHYTDLFTFNLTSPDNIVLDASSEQEGLCLYLYDLSNPSGAELIYNKCDDIYPFSPFIGTLITPIPLGAGTYSVELTTNDRKEAVAYTLSLNTLISSSTELNQVACSS